jgi:hypothetical protein
MRALDVVRKVVEAGAALRKRRSEGGSLVSADAALRVVEATTELARRARAGPLPPARGLERVALTAAQAQLRLMASLLGIPVSSPAEPPPPEPPPDTESSSHGEVEGAGAKAIQGFVSPGDQALVREEREAQIRAALGALVAEALALVDAVLVAPPEIASAGSGRVLGKGRGSP